jgi:hypothetical protein
MESRHILKHRENVYILPEKKKEPQNHKKRIKVQENGQKPITFNYEYLRLG